MKRNTGRLGLVIWVALGALATSGWAADWPFWGRDSSRNMVSDETGIPDDFDPGKYKENSEEIDMATTRNIRWIAKLGSQTYGNPTISGGKVFVGTNNESPRDPTKKGDRGILYCLDEKTGELIWQLAVPKLGTGKVSDWEFLGLCSSPAVEGNRVYIVTNRNEIMCLDTEGLANGNDGEFQNEAQYLAGPGKPPVTLQKTDADIIWRFDMREELGVFPHNITNCGPLIAGDLVVVTTSNGVDWTHTNIPNPQAPALCVVNKHTGKLVGEEASGVSARTLHSNWSSPAYGVVNGEGLIILGGGDGWLYGFETRTKKSEDGRDVLIEKWRFDCNPPHYRMKNGKPLKYATYDGPSEVIATPVFFNNRVYVPIGQDPEHGEGLGNFVCLDAATGKPIWQYDGIRRSLSTPAIWNGMVFVGDFSGYIHCLDADTGKPYWVFDTKSHIWGSPLVVDGKVYMGTEDGDIVILAADRTLKEIRRVDMRAPVYSSPVVANGTLYIATQTHLYAISTKQSAQSASRPVAPVPAGRPMLAKSGTATQGRCECGRHSQVTRQGWLRRALCPGYEARGQRVY
ncbi:MAG: PQQ-binding-like beta-propeller repeat protein [Chloroherpetonaceae bacterium]|nr:PQQ-binding-like beta-propeller repeat protein [Chthonomonadaceae bacterium]MDW8208785.1 PQQ-binding-like beta-propeller repeat protein [Chloroherpetonaceae bacterium]